MLLPGISYEMIHPSLTKISLLVDGLHEVNLQVNV